jgi:hypothetical protein
MSEKKTPQSKKPFIKKERGQKAPYMKKTQGKGKSKIDSGKKPKMQSICWTYRKAGH